jgi:hypothetical protein
MIILVRHIFDMHDMDTVGYVCEYLFPTMHDELN